MVGGRCGMPCKASHLIQSLGPISFALLLLTAGCSGSQTDPTAAQTLAATHQRWHSRKHRWHRSGCGKAATGGQSSTGGAATGGGSSVNATRGRPSTGGSSPSATAEPHRAQLAATSPSATGGTSAHTTGGTTAIGGQGFNWRPINNGRCPTSGGGSSAVTTGGKSSTAEPPLGRPRRNGAAQRGGRGWNRRHNQCWR